MSFSDFIGTFSYGINLFINSLFSFANNFISNYFFIVLVGLVLFVSLFWLVFDLISYSNFKKNKSDDSKYN